MGLSLSLFLFFVILSVAKNLIKAVGKAYKILRYAQNDRGATPF
jgi:hypothetical protein